MSRAARRQRGGITPGDRTLTDRYIQKPLTFARWKK